MNQEKTWRSYWFAFICAILLTTCETEDVSFQLPSICKSKCSMDMNSTETAAFCNKNPALKIQQRCCVNSSASIVAGIDLQDCNLTREAFSVGIQNLSSLIIISIQGNTITKLKKTDFNENTAIQYLSIPSGLECPGGADVWGNETFTASATVCMDELDPCTVHNVTCPKDSYCVHVGVDMANCLCDEGYHGYKCMKKGHFPFLAYGLGLSIPTVLVCIFLSITQRRYVKTKPKST